MDQALSVFRAATELSHAFLDPAFLRKSEELLRMRTLREFETDVIDDGGVRAFITRTGGFIEALFVDPPFQSMGYGKRLIDCAKSGSGALQLSVFARNPRAVKFYQREGFWATAVKKHHETGESIVLLKWEP